MSDDVWKEQFGAGGSRAIGHAWIDFQHTPDGIVLKVNQAPALRIAIKYRETGPYLSVECGKGSGETMGTCLRTIGMVKRYEELLETYNKVAEILHTGRMFLIRDEERQKQAATANDPDAP